MFFWSEEIQKGTPAGVFASGTIQELSPGTPPAPRVAQVRVDRVAGSKKEVVQQNWMSEDPVLSVLMTGEKRPYTAVALADDERLRLRALWANTGRDWNEDESLAGLWAYVQTLGGRISKKAGTPVVEVAERIGRAVSSVYNKVMNFRALDPRDHRDGLSGAGQTDRVVWARYYTPETEQLDSKRIHADYQRIWLKPEGKAGYEPDAAVRRAIENYAMSLAKKHYEAKGYLVEDTSANHAFDLRCTRAGEEVRVEVKGTRASGAYVSVEVTAGEVENARGKTWKTDLFVAWGLTVSRTEDQIIVAGTKVRIEENWCPTDEELEPLKFRYKVRL